ncbi:MAG: BPTD_3080 family restriction endonuclease [Phycisphaerae bacterium]
MKQVVIENPVINSPFDEPSRHFKFDETGITSDIATFRRPSSYFVPIPRPRKTGGKSQHTFDEWRSDRTVESDPVNRIRQRVQAWRNGRYLDDVSRTTARLLQHWRSEDRHRRLFFCQIEALETLIYITEVAKKYGDQWIENDLAKAGDYANPGLQRTACKLATGAGKTVVMAMVIAWHTLNKIANPQDARFSDAFLIVTPGITIRDRLRVLLPSDPETYYRTMDIVPDDLLEPMNRAKVIITNFHAFKRREKTAASKLTKAILGDRSASVFTESEGEMIRRVTRDLGTKKNIVVLNDEAHHCYRPKPDAADEQLTGEERKEAQENSETARIWISGLEALARKSGIRAIFDLSATPFFLRGSGYREGSLFPWVVSDFSLIDAIESGIVKVPRVPVSDDSGTGEQPTYRDLWLRIRDGLPKKGRNADVASGEPKPPAELEGALISLYGHYKKSFEHWQKLPDKAGVATTPPVFIVVCNNTNVSKMVFDYIAGWEKPLPDGSTAAVPGRLPLFSNVQDGRFIHRPNTILVDSQQLESGESMADDFKAIAAREIEEFKADYRLRFPDRDADKLTDEDLLREVLNTVGKQGKLGEEIRCVVSVSMLTEGWDANTVTHILGVRAFGTQLLCEQVIGRGLRRRSYEAESSAISVNGKPVTIQAFPVEYAEIYGVPFSFIPCSGLPQDPVPGLPPTRVRALPERSACEITFPRIDGYRYELPAERLTANFNESSRLTLSTQSVPTKTENAPIVGQTQYHTLDDYKTVRLQTVAFEIARTVLEQYFTDLDNNRKEWLFPDLVSIARDWISQCVVLKDNTFPQLLLWSSNRRDAADRIYKAVVQTTAGEKQLLPIAKPYDTVGSTQFVQFDTRRPVYKTRPDKCHISHVVADTDSWEQKMAETLEDMDEVICYVKNSRLGFEIPYTIDGVQRHYEPDFIARIDDGHGPSDPLNLIIEVTGDGDRKKAAKVSTAKTLWVPAVNNAGQWGRWAIIEVDDPWAVKAKIVEMAAVGCK